MSVVTKLSNAVYCGFLIGQCVERRRHWMERARENKRGGRDVDFAVRIAREQSREIVAQLRLLRREALPMTAAAPIRRGEAPIPVGAVYGAREQAAKEVPTSQR